MKNFKEATGTDQQQYSVVQIIDRLYIGGAERILVTLSNILYAKGHKVKVITTVAPGPLTTQLNPGVIFQNLNRGWKWNPLTMLRLVQAIKDFDIIHVHSRHNLRYLLLAKALFGLKKKIFYHEHHGHRINTKATSLEKKLFPSAVFIAVSEALKNWAINEAAVDPANAFVLPNIVLKEKIASVQRKDSTVQLLMVANFVPVKNMAFAIELLEQLIQENKNNYHLTIAGAAADKSYLNSIVALIAQKKLQDHITFIHDCISVQALLPGFDLALHTAKSESGPLVLIEYMAQGLPFITYKTGEVVQQVKSDLPDFIMQSFDTAEWITAIEQLLQKDKKALQLKLQDLFDAYYSADAYYEKCMFIYRKGM